MLLGLGLLRKIDKRILAQRNMDAYFAIYTCYPYYHLFRSLFFNNLQDLAYGTLPLDLRMDVCEQEISTSHDGNVRKQGRKEQRPRW
mmetsp:Transcript_32542/g.55443  ORF Transcript_32542/g.55443 Transcript_32542/m.55443 type:complete len:87 (+) Transcript_32542:500-760(+)